MYCAQQHNGHLWSINSHAEWWNINQNLGLHEGKIGTSNDSDARARMYASVYSTLSFIGVQWRGEVRWRKAHC